MPHRRRVQKGSFGSHFDELVKQFAPDRPATKPVRKSSKRKRKLTAAALNQALFERASDRPH